MATARYSSFVVLNSKGEFFNGWKFVREFPSAMLYETEQEACGIARVCGRRDSVTVVRDYGRENEKLVLNLPHESVLPSIELLK